MIFLLSQVGVFNGAINLTLPAKASHFGRGVTVGDGEGKDADKITLALRYDIPLEKASYRNVQYPFCRACPLRRLRASSPKGRAFGSPHKLHLFAKVSPFGRGVTVGDGEGEDATLCDFQHL